MSLHKSKEKSNIPPIYMEQEVDGKWVGKLVKSRDTCVEVARLLEQTPCRYVRINDGPERYSYYEGRIYRA